MKLLHVVSTAQRRGAEIFASDLAGELRWRGFDQLVAVVHGSSTPDVDFHAPARAMERGGSTVLRLRPRACWDLRALARTWRPDVIVAHGGEALKYTVVAGPTAGSCIAGSGQRRRGGSIRSAGSRMRGWRARPGW